MAEEEGFEPPEPFPAHLISSQAQSTTLALLRDRGRSKPGKVEGVNREGPG